MIWKTSDHFLANDNSKGKAKAMSTVNAISPDLAASYARKMLERETRGNGDQMGALERVGRKCGLSARALRRLLSGETKDPGITVFGRIRMAYLKYCESQISELAHEIAADKARYGDDAFEDLGAEVQALAEKIKAAKERVM